ncbi:bifunctional cobalt-precorrin-7 (C(5))-methyltransferase/cobalt-precorrin-6B (C(15))-methyltransferase [Clostridia bacterium]|nr:bifunctional cobalt-precorrin-7 (C(5))-methyltransferase/cobalt-precorrin-6B (C(15))-methyltransferase [Clostridia bacterium]
MRKLIIIGAGMGNPSLLTGEARRWILEADAVVGPERLSESLKPVRGDILFRPLAEFADAIRKSKGEKIAALVSGDAGFFSVSKTLREKLGAEFEIETVNGLNSLQYLASRLGTSYDDAEVVSLHGRDVPICGAVSYNQKTFVLTGGKYKAHDVCAELASSGLAGVRVTVGENLSSGSERILTGSAGELAEMEFDDLTVMLVENREAVSTLLLLRDTDFVRGEVPMTKEEVRCIAIAKLGVLPGHTVFDIGSGTGSVSIELARKACRGTVYAVERDPEAVALTEENRKRHGAYNIKVIAGRAPEVLGELPPPDRVFIGGSGGNIGEILSLLMEKGSFRVCITAISLSTLNSALSSVESHGFTGIDVVCANISRSKKVGAHYMMMAQNPIYVISGDYLCAK